MFDSRSLWARYGSEALVDIVRVRTEALTQGQGKAHYTLLIKSMEREQWQE